MNEALQPTPATPTEPATTPTPPTEPTSEPSLLNQDPKPTEPPKEPTPGAPDKYTDFKLPEGYELDKGVLEEASPIFKELNLSQDQAQKLVDLYSKHALATEEQHLKLFQETQQKWISEIKTDPEIGGKLDQVKTTVARAIDGLGDPKLAADFRQAMDYTGAGNNPAFIRAFYKLASKLTEGGFVSGRGPAPQGQRANGASRPSAAQAIYPGGPITGRRIGPSE